MDRCISTFEDMQYSQRFKRFAPDVFFLWVGVVFGILMCVLIPYGAGFDEETHLVRIYDLSGFNLIPNRSAPEGTIAPITFFSLSYQRRYFQDSAIDLLQKDQFLKKNDWQILVYSTTRSIYSPIIFIPQAFVTRLCWRILDLPVIPVVILCRLSGLLVYLLGSWFAIRLIPTGKWVLAILALSPMALFQAATINADGFTNTISFLWVAGLLNMALDASENISSRKIFLLVVGTLFLGFAKPSTILILPLLIILPWKRLLPGQRLWIIGGMVVAVVFTLGWSFISVSGSHFTQEGDQNLADQLGLVLADPLAFIVAFAQTVFDSTGAYYRDWVGVYGHWVGVVPSSVYWLYPLALFAALVSESRNNWLTKKLLIGFWGTFGAASLAVLLMHFLVNYHPDNLNAFQSQGRYFIGLTPLLYVPVSSFFAFADPAVSWFRKGGAAVVLVTLLLYTFGILASYYIVCGTTFYTGQNCVLPIYKNLDKANAPYVEVYLDSTVQQSFTNTCNRLSGVQVLVKSNLEQKSSILHFALLDLDDHPIFEQDYSNVEIVANSYLSLMFNPVTVNPGEIYVMRLSSENSAQEQSFRLATSLKDFYLDGELYINNEPVDVDLIFHYICPPLNR
ncbi:MAG TPA: DUF2142 domain-containing protein [Anaerolineaceae bacterium]|nr:DUF2142 domain-containing protein [Anaerolineaceae bacterium]HQH84824.1 DUF2142 domain-containing protein [Anaerolineaceae bacterium]